MTNWVLHMPSKIIQSIPSVICFPVIHERSLALDYRAKVTPWLDMQPFAQYLLHLDSEPSEKTKWFGMFFQVEV